MKNLYQIAITMGIGVVISGCAGMSIYTRKSTNLPVYGQYLDSPPVVRFIVPGSPAARVLSTGDKVIAIDARPVRTIQDFYKTVSTEKIKTLTIQSPRGATKTFSWGDIKTNSGTSFFLVTPGQTLIEKKKGRYGREQDVGIFAYGHVIGTAIARVWNTRPRFIEIGISLKAADDCHDCTFRNLALEDWTAKSFLRPVPPLTVAYALLPQAGEVPSALMPIPAPTVSGYTSTSSTFGTANGTVVGNTLHSTYSGTTTSTITPSYNYSGTLFAEGYNLGAVIRANQIQNAKQSIRNFIVSREGNLHLGTMNPGEAMTGAVFFSLPSNLHGPFVLLVVGDKKQIGTVRFGR